MDDLISRQAAIEVITQLLNEFEEICATVREENGDDSVCGLCEYDGAYVGESGDWCNECPGFNREDCFEMREDYRQKWINQILTAEKTGRWV